VNVDALLEGFAGGGLAGSTRVPARPARTVPLPPDLPVPLPQRLELAGVSALYTHQSEALAHVRAGRHVVVATGSASGKSLCYQLPVLEQALRDPQATALYLAPTKALARDQLRALRAFRVPQVKAAAYDGDTPRAERDAIRRTANVLLTNPDMLHHGLLPSHQRWGDFIHRLGLVIVDECHAARGLFGAHVAAILRRLRRICTHYSSAPTFILASATIGNPAEHAASLTGLDAEAVTDDGAPKPPVTLVLWDPPMLDPVIGARRSALAETADLLTTLVEEGAATLAFVKSRKGAELVAAHSRRLLAPVGLDELVMAYRAGYLPEERRAVERALVEGALRGVAATDALELGVDIGRLDAVVIAGWPGTAASLWQQAGRAGRRDREAMIVFVAGDDPLDHYLLTHPDQLWGRPVEAAIADVTNPYVLGPHLRCAAWELPLASGEPTERGSRSFGLGDLDNAAAPLIARDLADGVLRERRGRVYWAGRGSPATAVSIRSAGQPFAIVEADTGVLVGDVDGARAYRTVHEGAVYLHQGETYRVRRLDLDRRTALVERYFGDEYTRPRADTDLTVLEVLEEAPCWGPRTGAGDSGLGAVDASGPCRMMRGRVEVTTTVLAYERRRLFTDEPLGLVDLDLPPLRLVTQALWLVVPPEVRDRAGLRNDRVPGSLHAAEHAAIGLLPLFAMCDRWDIGGVSTPWHPDTGDATIFIYDGYPGGAGISERGFQTGARHLRATLDAITACPCATGCPSCVQSPKCGNGNEPLDKDGAAALLRAVLATATGESGVGA
jgi:DEAD/DEAH box helicase domain-containing protein